MLGLIAQYYCALAIQSFPDASRCLIFYSLPHTVLNLTRKVVTRVLDGLTKNDNNVRKAAEAEWNKLCLNSPDSLGRNCVFLLGLYLLAISSFSILLFQ